MPQGSGGVSSVPTKAPGHIRYARRVASEAASAGRVFKTVTSIRAEQNAAFREALPRMTRNAEGFTARRLVAGGSSLRLGEFTRLADEEIIRDGAKRASGRRDVVAAALARRRVKGKRGVLEGSDLNELAALAPALREQLDVAEAIRKTAAKRRHAHLAAALGEDKALAAIATEAAPSDDAAEAAIAAAGGAGAATAAAGRKRARAVDDEEQVREARQALALRGELMWHEDLDASEVEDAGAVAGPDAAKMPPSKRARPAATSGGALHLVSVRDSGPSLPTLFPAVANAATASTAPVRSNGGGGRDAVRAMNAALRERDAARTAAADGRGTAWRVALGLNAVGSGGAVAAAAPAARRPSAFAAAAAADVDF